MQKLMNSCTFFGVYLSSDMLSGMKLETCVYRVCEKCRTMTNTRNKQIYHQVSWEMSQEEWNRGKISLNKLLKKEHVKILNVNVIIVKLQLHK